MERRLFFSFGKLLVLAYLITGVLLILLAAVLYKFQLNQSVVNIGIILIYCIANFVTGFMAGKTQRKKRFLWGLLLGVVYFGILCLISLGVKGSIKEISGNFLTAMVLCMGSGMLGGMVS